MWNKPYTLKEGTAIVAGLLVTGGLLQVTLGPLEWGLFAWPANFITLILFVFLLIVAYLLRKRQYLLLQQLQYLLLSWELPSKWQKESALWILSD